MQNATLWRALLGVEKTVVENIEFDEDEQLLVADVQSRKRGRGRCGRCQRRPPVASVAWARHAAGHTLAFDETVGWLATQCSKSAVTELIRIGWRTVGSIIARVWADVEARTDRLAGLARIGRRCPARGWWQPR